MWAALCNVAVGVWLMAAPGVLGYGAPAATSDRVLGPLVATFAGVAVCQSVRSARWANLPLGIWLVFAPWVLGYGPPAAVNGVLSGLVVSALSIPRGRVTHRFGGGWAGVLRSP